MIQNIRKFKVTNNITIHKISTAKDYFQLINPGQLPFLSKLLYLRDRERGRGGTVLNNYKIEIP